MSSLILHVVSRILLPVAFAYSIYLLWRGHNEPGGGFVGGLIMSAGLIIYALPRGRLRLVRFLRVPPEAIAGGGVLLAAGSGMFGLLRGQAFMTHQWTTLPTGLAVGTPLMFDTGVYLAVVGAVLTFLIYYLEP